MSLKKRKSIPSDSKTAVARHKFKFAGINKAPNRWPFGVGRELGSFRKAVFSKIRLNPNSEYLRMANPG